MTVLALGVKIFELFIYSQEYRFFQKMQIVYIILTVLALWLLVVTVLNIFVLKFFSDLSKGTDRGSLFKVLEKVLDNQKDQVKEISKIKSEIEIIKEGDQVHLQKIGVVRFNPFEELGGDHSFSVALLDAKDSGLILTGLHTRERTRVYAKKIKRGKPEVELSVEELKALSIAQRNDDPNI